MSADHPSFIVRQHCKKCDRLIEYGFCRFCNPSQFLLMRTIGWIMLTIMICFLTLSFSIVFFHLDLNAVTQGSMWPVLIAIIIFVIPGISGLSIIGLNLYIDQYMRNHPNDGRISAVASLKSKITRSFAIGIGALAILIYFMNRDQIDDTY